MAHAFVALKFRTKFLNVLGGEVQRDIRGIVLRWCQGIRNAEARRTSCHQGCIATVDVKVQSLLQVFLEIFVDAVLRIHEIL